MDKFIDWHPADIVAGLRKRGTSLTRPWPKGELIIATALETQPWVIWPSRYHDPVTHEFIDRTQMMRQKKIDK